MTRARLLAGALFYLVLLSGCASTPQTRALIDSPPGGLPPQVELIDTPFFPQQRYQCGPAALATILTPQGMSISPNELVDEVYLPARKGSLQPEMLAAIRRRGLLAVELPRTLPTILSAVQEGHPVLVLQNLGLSWYPKWHYAVVVGYDLEGRHVVLRSGTIKRWVTPFAVFERTWQRGRHWAVVAVPPGSIPQGAPFLAMLKATSDLEETGQLQAARRSYGALIEHWPNEPLAHFGFGNALAEGGDLAKATHSYRTAVELDPRFVAAWNNLAYALAAKGCRQQAIEAARCAGALAPGDANIAGTLADIKGSTDGGASCAPLECPVVPRP